MKCKCGGEIDLTIGKCKECNTQNMNMSGNASITIKESDGSITKISSKKQENNNIRFLMK